MELTFQDFLSQGPVMHALYQQIQDGTAAHVILITGPSGIGKKSLAGLIARGLLCRGSGYKPCGICATCLDRAAAFAANGVTDPALD